MRSRPGPTTIKSLPRTPEERPHARSRRPAPRVHRRRAAGARRSR
ncbi:hypothetical protein AKJ08_1548 [Vulgatibacter incomptus]|uniref:Uncharacterized protein n=1 Tax=Vulgatibacter incomptus TaxID=1391653 RepID=A0A0K1PCL3_9BACT|nr:hypothetical protein AKJ08_1548 [Vulgatibacter incomptus]